MARTVDSPNLATVTHHGISLMDTALHLTLEPVSVLESSSSTLVWVQVLGTVLAGIAAVASVVVAFRAHSFARNEECQPLLRRTSDV